MVDHAVAALRFVPVVPGWALGVLLTMCAAAAVLGLVLRARGAVLRALAFAVLGFWLSGPTLVQETRQGLSDIAVLAVDRSASMQVGDRTRLADAAEAKLRAAAAHLPELDLRTVSVPEAGHDGTALWSAVTRALADIPENRLAGIIAVTDGQVHDLPAKPPAQPVHALLTGKGEEWDRRVRIVEAPAYGIVGRTLTLKVVVEDLGPAPAGTDSVAQLTVQRDGTPPVRQTVPVGVVQSLPVDITRAGLTVLKLSTDPAPGEASPVNNQAVVQINGVRDRLRVLLVSGEPNQGERTWRRLLKADPAVDLVHFTILRPPEKDDTTPLNELALIAFPTRELFQEKLSGFDLIILDRFTDRGVLPHIYLRNIADYVRHGGALLLTVGPEFAGARSLDQTPLGAVLPVHQTASGSGIVDAEFTPKVTKLGERHPVTDGLSASRSGAGSLAAALAGVPAGAPWGPWERAIAGDDVQGQVLMTGPESLPLLVLNHVDKGRAAMLMSDQIWLWSAGHKGGGPQADLLRRVAHWLMKEPELDEERLAARIEAGRLVIERRSVDTNAATPVTVTAPDGGTRTLALKADGAGRAMAEVAAPAPGIWQASDGTHVAIAAVGQDNPLEYADLRATAEKMRPLAAGSGGGLAWLARGVPDLRRVGEGENAAGPGWIGLVRRGAHLVTGVDTVPLLPPALAVALLLGLVVAAWRREAA